MIGNKSKLLIAIPSPRDIPEVTDNWTLYEHDVVVVKYSQQKSAYKYLRDYFLEHEEYTHFCIMPDDLVVTTEQLETLWKDAKRFTHFTTSGVCPVDEDTTRPKGIPLAIQIKIPIQTEGDETKFPRDWLYKHELDKLDVEILRVDHSGFCCSIIPRQVMEEVSWRGSTKINQDMEGNFDWQFSQDCKKLGYPIHVDTTVMLKHLRNQQSKEAKENPLNKQSFVYFINCS